MLKKFTKGLLILFVFFFLVAPAKAAEITNKADETKHEGPQPKIVYFFWSKSCPHCAREKTFLRKLDEKYERLEIKDFEITDSQENRELFQRVGERFSAQGYVPFTVVGEYHFVGYLDDQTTGREIEEAVQCFLADGCRDVVAELIEPQPPQRQTVPETLDLPFLGEIKTQNLSLPALTFVIALLDGFNPCAMWILLFLISLFLGMKDRTRMWALGTTFIIASGVVYFLFLSAWLNLFLFLGFVLWVRVMVGLVAMAAGGYSLRDFWVNKEGGCETAGNEKRQKVFEKIRNLTQKREFLLALGGIILLAFTVNLIELVCSAGLPAIYTQILSLSKMSRWQYYFYLLFYILIFMLDDLFVFVVAMVTLKAVGVQTKYARYSRLIGGLLMLAIGFLLLFRPEWLMFG